MGALKNPVFAWSKLTGHSSIHVLHEYITSNDTVFNNDYYRNGATATAPTLGQNTHRAATCTV